MGIMIAGTSSGCGKTTVAIGIMAALKDRRLNIAPFKVGPDYIDPGFHTDVTGTTSHNLDSMMLDEGSLKYLYSKYSQNKKAVIEGVMGLYDGYGIAGQGSSAHVAKILNVPVVLVIDGRAVSTSAAAMVKGFESLDQTVNIAGVIVNRVSGESHYQMIKTAVETYTGVPCVGFLPKDSQIALSSRHLGLIPQQEVKDLNLKIDRLKHLVNQHIELDKLIQIIEENESTVAKTPEVIVDFYERNCMRTQSWRIGIARDAAFSFYYQANLDLLSESGVEWIPLSPLVDNRLPEHLDGLYIGGGFPEVYAKPLNVNQSLMVDLKTRLKQGLKCYAECGGFMYLSNRIKTLENVQYEMTGFFDIDCEMTQRLQRFGYVTVQYGSFKFNAHEFHHSRMIGESPDYQYCITKPGDQNPNRVWRCGVKKKNTLAGYPHVHFYANPAFAERVLLDG